MMIPECDQYPHLAFSLDGVHRTNDRVAELMACEYNATEIAQVLGMSVNHVRVCMTRVRRGMGEGAR